MVVAAVAAGMVMAVTAETIDADKTVVDMTDNNHITATEARHREAVTTGITVKDMVMVSITTSVAAIAIETTHIIDNPQINRTAVADRAVDTVATDDVWAVNRHKAATDSTETTVHSLNRHHPLNQLNADDSTSKREQSQWRVRTQRHPCETRRFLVRARRGTKQNPRLKTNRNLRLVA